jgi:hypothetical protein
MDTEPFVEELPLNLVSVEVGGNEHEDFLSCLFNDAVSIEIM